MSKNLHAPHKDHVQEQPKEPEQKESEQPAKNFKEGKLFCRAVFGGPMINPNNEETFTSIPIYATNDGWLKSQMEAGKIEEV